MIASAYGCLPLVQTSRVHDTCRTCDGFVYSGQSRAEHAARSWTRWTGAQATEPSNALEEKATAPMESFRVAHCRRGVPEVKRACTSYSGTVLKKQPAVL